MEKQFKLTESKVATDDKYVMRTGRIFRAGSYPDKKFEMTPEELIAAEAAFSPVILDVEHHDNLGILNGKLGSLEAVYSSEDGEELFGTVKMPKWLHDLNVDEDGNPVPISVSCTWGRDDKKLKKLALVTNPRVSDASIFAAFAENEIKENPKDTEVANKLLSGFFSLVSTKDFSATWVGKDLMQWVHDKTASAGAICTEMEDDDKSEMSSGKKKVKFVSKEESATIQELHDMSVKSGAKCTFVEDNAMGRPWAMYSKDDKPSSTKTGRNKNMFKEMAKWFKDQPDEVLEKMEEQFSDDSDEVKELKAKLAEANKALAAKETPKVEEPTKLSAEKVEKEVETPNPEVAELKAKLDAAEAELKASKEKAAFSDAQSIAEDYIKENKITPATKEAVTALFHQAVKDDAATSIDVTFSDDSKAVSRVEVLKAFFSKLEGHNLTTEELTSKKANVLNFKEGDKAVDLTEAKNLAIEFAKAENAKRAKTAKV